MEYTQNYNLRKPEDTDPADIQDLNYNADVIDGKLKEIEDWEAAHLQASNPHSITPALIGAETPTGAQQKANQAETNAKSYADTVANSALNSAKDYADDVLESANSYTDQVASDLSQKVDEKLNETRIKVLDVEQDVSNISKVLTSLNPNQEAKQSVSGYGILSLPKNAANGQVSATVAGQTATNLVINGKGDSTEGWWKQDQVTITEDGFYEIDTSGIVRARLRAKTFAGRKYLLTFVGQCISGTQWALLCQLSKGSSSNTDVPTSNGAVILYPSHTDLKRRYAIFNSTDDGEAISIYRTDAGEGDSAKYHIKEITLFDVTDMEGTDEEIFNEINTKFPHYFSGTKSTVSAIRLKSVGKNLLPHKEGVQGFKDWSAQFPGRFKIEGEYFNHFNTGRVYSKPFFLEKGDYTIQLLGQAVGGSNYSVYMVDVNDKAIGTIMAVLNNLRIYSQTINVADKGWYRLRIQSGISGLTAKFKDVSIEKGTIATEYEPYKESVAYITAKNPETGKILELHSLPNGTKDEIRVSENKLIKRISEKTNVASGTVINYADMADNGTYYAWNDEGETETGVKGDTLGIYATELIYQLAQPIEQDIDVSGTLLSYPSGTVYIENVVADAGIYTDKMTVLHNDLPIKEVEKLSKVDFTTGQETELDVSQCVISTNKLSFTHPNLVSGDIIFFTYYYDKEGTQGECEVEYYDSRYVIKDSVTEKFYKWHIAVADGIPTIELTEV